MLSLSDGISTIGDSLSIADSVVTGSTLTICAANSQVIISSTNLSNNSLSFWINWEFRVAKFVNLVVIYNNLFQHKFTKFTQISI